METESCILYSLLGELSLNGLNGFTRQRNAAILWHGFEILAFFDKNLNKSYILSYLPCILSRKKYKYIKTNKDLPTYL